MKRRHTCRNEQGSYTVEAVIIMSIVFFAVFLLCFSFMLMYHRVLLTKAAHEIAEQAANEWTRGSSPYYRIFEINSNGRFVEKTIEGALDAEKLRESFRHEEKITNAVEEKLALMLKKTFPKLLRWIKEPQKTTVKISFENGLIMQKVFVEITQEMKIPFGQLKKVFDGKAEAVLQAQSTAVITDPAETIRNADLVMEYATKVNEKLDFAKLVEKVTKAAPQAAKGN
jgi:hypothetical protein